MEPQYPYCRIRRYRGGRHGFTLIEILVALTVIGVATTVMFKFYLMSTDLGNLAQHRGLAASIAENHLTQLIADPAGYVWDYQNPDEQGFFRIKGSIDDPRAGAKAVLPDVLLPLDVAYKRQVNVYEKFRWSAFGRLSSPDSSFFEVTVDVHWKQADRTENVALTGVVPRFKVDSTWVEK